MAQTPLKRLIAHRRQEIAALLEWFAAQTGAYLQILDADGQPLAGQGAENAECALVQCGGETTGWVAGLPEGGLLALFLEQLLGLEEEKHALADEALVRYREINLLHSLSQKLAASLEVRPTALTAIEEARRLIRFSTGALLLVNAQAERLEWIAGVGRELAPIPLGEGIQGRVAKSGRAEVINDVCLEVGHSPAEEGFCALLCSPLFTRGRVIGILMLANETSIAYTASDLKLLNTLASQAAPAIENALRYEDTLRKAREREERLQRQIQELRIELDENRQVQKAGEITETDYFRGLREQAESLRQIVEGLD